MTDGEVSRLAARVRLFLTDVDGVMTDGRFSFVPMPDGTVVEARTFDSQDGFGMALARRSGIRLGIISGRTSPSVSRRAGELKIEFCYLGLGSSKRDAFDEIAVRAGLPGEDICYVGDDLPDLPILRRVGFPVAVANACPEVKAAAAYVTRRSGGDGALREVLELILRAQGKWESAISEYTA